MTSPLRQLSLDLGTRSGWAVSRWQPGGRPQSILEAHGTWTGGSWPMVCVLPSLIIAKAVEHRVTEIAYEAVSFHQSTQAAHAFGELRAAVLQAGQMLGIPVSAVMTSQVKVAATGNGRAKKPQVVMAALEVFGDEIRHEDAAEAIWVGEARWMQLSGELPEGDTKVKRGKGRVSA